MKLVFQFLLVIITISVFSCQENRKTTFHIEEEIQEIDSAATEPVKVTDDELDEEVQQAIEEAKKRFKKHIKNDEGQTVIKEEYKLKSKAYKSNLYVTVKYGNIFNKRDIHAVITVGSSYRNLICVYYYNKSEGADSLDTLLYTDKYYNIYDGDTIQDVNGDKNKDFVIKAYPMSGCCLAELRDVYLFRTANKFSEKYRFVNPTFYPKEKVIRGLTYDHNPSLYKYKWNKLKIDTVEHITPNLEDTTRNSFYKTKKWLNPYDLKNIKKIKLNSIPKEYYSIDNFDVFLRR